MSTSIPTTAARLTCLCGLISLPGTYLAETSFPFPSTVCHCNPCRYTSGGLLPAFADVTSAPPPDIRKNLTAYQFTPSCVRYFCSTCGCHCFVEHPQAKKEEWYCTAGIIELAETEQEKAKDVLQLTGHMYIDDLGDGGTVPLFLPITTNGPQTLYGARHGTRELSPRQLEARAQVARQYADPGAEDLLEARCHCGSVDLRIKRAELDTEPEGVKSLMERGDPHRYLARFCACRSCRLSMGFSLCPWTYVALSSVLNVKTSQPVRFGIEAEKEGVNEGLKLKHYRSSEGVWRSFCGGCGASVFYYTSDETRSDVVDVAVGLLRAKSGSMAGEWVRWADGEVSHGGEGTNQCQVKCIQGHGRIE